MGDIMKAIIVINMEGVDHNRLVDDNFEDGRLVVDKAYLNTCVDDDSFKTFEFLGAVSDDAPEEVLQNVTDAIDHHNEHWCG